VVPEVSDLIRAPVRDGARTWFAHSLQCIWRWVQVYRPELDNAVRASIHVHRKSCS
jgi:hypothetical protein